MSTCLVAGEEEEEEEEDDGEMHTMATVEEDEVNTAACFDLAGSTYNTFRVDPDSDLVYPENNAGADNFWDDPYDENYEGYMGNSGPTLDQFYRRAVVILVPKRLAVWHALQRGSLADAIRVIRASRTSDAETGTPSPYTAEYLADLREAMACAQPIGNLRNETGALLQLFSDSLDDTRRILALLARPASPALGLSALCGGIPTQAASEAIFTALRDAGWGALGEAVLAVIDASSRDSIAHAVTLYQLMTSATMAGAEEVLHRLAARAARPQLSHRDVEALVKLLFETPAIGEEERRAALTNLSAHSTVTISSTLRELNVSSMTPSCQQDVKDFFVLLANVPLVTGDSNNQRSDYILVAASAFLNDAMIIHTALPSLALPQVLPILTANMRTRYPHCVAEVLGPLGSLPSVREAATAGIAQARQLCMEAVRVTLQRPGMAFGGTLTAVKVEFILGQVAVVGWDCLAELVLPAIDACRAEDLVSASALSTRMSAQSLPGADAVLARVAKRAATAPFSTEGSLAVAKLLFETAGVDPAALDAFVAHIVRAPGVSLSALCTLVDQLNVVAITNAAHIDALIAMLEAIARPSLELHVATAAATVTQFISLVLKLESRVPALRTKALLSSFLTAIIVPHKRNTEILTSLTSLPALVSAAQAGHESARQMLQTRLAMISAEMPVDTFPRMSGSVPGYPSLSGFLAGASTSTSFKAPISGIAQARHVASRLGAYGRGSLTYSFSTTATGTGTNARVVVTKTRDFHQSHLDDYHRRMAERKRIIAILGLTPAEAARYAPAPPADQASAAAAGPQAAARAPLPAAAAAAPLPPSPAASPAARVPLAATAALLLHPSQPSSVTPPAARAAAALPPAAPATRPAAPHATGTVRPPSQTGVPPPKAPRLNW
eukprot:m.103231 g.103231  ORF g.103231 m.103231 type:complete len:899 (-) comp8847_c0_seq1:94-2790(-)